MKLRKVVRRIEQQAQAIDADGVARADRRHQVEALGELPLARPRSSNPSAERRDAAAQTKAVVTHAMARSKRSRSRPTGEQRQRASKGDEGDDGQEMTCHVGSILF